MLDLTEPVIVFGLAVVAAWVLQKIVNFRRAVRSIGNHPGLRTLLGDRLPYIPCEIPGVFPAPMTDFNCADKRKRFNDAGGWDIVSGVCVFPTTEATLYLSNAAAIKEVMAARSRFPKAIEDYKILSTFGSNILITEGEEWRNQRRIASPAFSERNNRLVWDETVKIMEDIFASDWAGKDAVEVDQILELTVPIALLIIGIAAFGRRMSWKEDQVAPPGYSMTFKSALEQVSLKLFLAIVFSDWQLRWGTPTMRQFRLAYQDLQHYMHEMVEGRRAEKVKVERYDLFSGLLDASEAEHDTARKLTDDELYGNVFIFLLAGHETTAHTLAYTFILLALYPEAQEKMYEDLQRLFPDGRTPAYEDFGALSRSYVMAVLNETLRLYPPAASVPKRAAEDAILVATHPSGEKRQVPCPRGTYILIHLASLHYNPQYWEDPYEFKPERFMKPYNRDAFLPFSGGARGCIGRGFAETEGLAILAMLFSRYRVEVKEEPQFAGETFQERKQRLLKTRQAITLYPVRAPIVFKRR